MLITNVAYSVYDKSTGKQTLGPTYIHSIWTGFGGQCEQYDGGDPVVLYDKLAHRWLVEQLEYTTSPQICVAVSATDDATGSYHRYVYSTVFLDDYPKVGIWPDAYYLSSNTGRRVCRTLRHRPQCHVSRQDCKHDLLQQCVLQLQVATLRY